VILDAPGVSVCLIQRGSGDLVQCLRRNYETTYVAESTSVFVIVAESTSVFVIVAESTSVFVILRGQISKRIEKILKWILLRTYVAESTSVRVIVALSTSVFVIVAESTSVLVILRNR
jgi:hypothetical protein